MAQKTMARLISLVVLFSLAACHPGSGPHPASPLSVKELKNYEFSATTPLISRVRPLPPFVLSYLKEMDKNAGYVSYTPTPAETEQLTTYLDLLPPAHRRLMQERLIAIYFVDGYQGSGLTDYVFDDAGVMHLLLVLNPELLRTDISTWLTRKEESCFLRDTSEIVMTVNCGRRFTGLMYILLHESAHMLDYVGGYTPYVEPDLKRPESATPSDSLFTRGVWQELDRPLPAVDFPLRNRVTFYGLNGGPKLSRKDAPELYRSLSATPFASLYGSQNWAEDFADLLTFHHLTATFGEPYEISLFDRGERIAVYSPMKNPAVINRLKLLAIPFD